MVLAYTFQKVTGKLLDLSLAPGGAGMGGEGAEAWMGGGGEKIFLLNKYVHFLSNNFG
jgi:20S proteasome subunit alpha 3